jgi:hypothetical protein
MLTADHCRLILLLQGRCEELTLLSAPLGLGPLPAATDHSNAEPYRVVALGVVSLHESNRAGINFLRLFL